MKPFQIEAWALRILDQVLKGQPNEDSLVELKSTWIDPKKAARILAGHANAAKGASILWLMGMDEKNGAVGAATENLADWYAIVSSQFDGMAPGLTDLNISVDGRIVVALLFETDRAPFVVKNPDGGQIQFEVPWRVGTRLKTANRSELIRILSPITELPSLEFLRGEVIAYPNNTSQTRVEVGESSKYVLECRLTFYIVPPTDRRVVLPFHRAKAEILTGENYGFLSKVNDLHLSRDAESRRVGYLRGNEVKLDGPSMVMLEGAGFTGRLPTEDVSTIRVRGDLYEARSDRPVTFDISLPARMKTMYNKGRWAIDMLLEIDDDIGGTAFIDDEDTDP